MFSVLVGNKVAELEISKAVVLLTSGNVNVGRYPLKDCKKWSAYEDALILCVGSGRAADEVVLHTDRASEIGGWITAKCSHPIETTLALGTKAPRKLAVDTSEDDDDNEALPTVGDKFICTKAATLRETAAMDSAPTGALLKTSVIEVLESTVNETGQTRIRCSRGWTSIYARSGAALLEKADRSLPEEFLEPPPAEMPEPQPEPSPPPAAAPKKKSARRRMSISGNKAPVVTSEMLGGIKQYEVKKGSKKMQ
eukprot:SAG22_NODE_3318_length_1782_cov_1.431967_1_plen_252_part_10